MVVRRSPRDYPPERRVIRRGGRSLFSNLVLNALVAVVRSGLKDLGISVSRFSEREPPHS